METLYMAAGISSLWSNVLNNWVGPLFLAAVAVFALVFIKDRAWMKLIGFVGIAAVVGVLIWGGQALFGSSGTLKGTAQSAAGTINTVVLK